MTHPRIKEWLDTCAILYPCIKHILKQSMKIVTNSVHRKWDRLVTYWLTLVYKIKKNITNLSSAELAQRMLKVKPSEVTDIEMKNKVHKSFLPCQKWRISIPLNGCFIILCRLFRVVLRRRVQAADIVFRAVCLGVYCVPKTALELPNLHQTIQLYEHLVLKLLVLHNRARKAPTALWTLFYLFLFYLFIYFHYYFSILVLDAINRLYMKRVCLIKQ